MKGCPRAVREFGRTLNEWLNRESSRKGAFGVLLSEDLEGWTRGGCWILAEALHRWLDAPMWAVTIKGSDWGPQVSHVVVRVGHCFLDGDGAWTGAELVRSEEEMRRAWTDLEVGMDSFDPVRALGLVCPVRAVQDVVAGLEREFGDGVRVRRILSGTRE